MSSQSIAYLLGANEHIYWILDLEGEVHSIWVLWTNNLHEYKGSLMAVNSFSRDKKTLIYFYFYFCFYFIGGDVRGGWIAGPGSAEHDLCNLA